MSRKLAVILLMLVVGCTAKKSDTVLMRQSIIEKPGADKLVSSITQIEFVNEIKSYDSSILERNVRLVGSSEDEAFICVSSLEEVVTGPRATDYCINFDFNDKKITSVFKMNEVFENSVYVTSIAKLSDTQYFSVVDLSNDEYCMFVRTDIYSVKDNNWNLVDTVGSRMFDEPEFLKFENSLIYIGQFTDETFLNVMVKKIDANGEVTVIDNHKQKAFLENTDTFDSLHYLTSSHTLKISYGQETVEYYYALFKSKYSDVCYLACNDARMVSGKNSRYYSERLNLQEYISFGDKFLYFENKVGTSSNEIVIKLEDRAQGITMSEYKGKDNQNYFNGVSLSKELAFVRSYENDYLVSVENGEVVFYTFDGKTKYENLLNVGDKKFIALGNDPTNGLTLSLIELK